MNSFPPMLQSDVVGCSTESWLILWSIIRQKKPLVASLCGGWTGVNRRFYDAVAAQTAILMAASVDDFKNLGT